MSGPVLGLLVGLAGSALLVAFAAIQIHRSSDNRQANPQKEDGS